jgi:hypothetical protein
MRKNIAETFVVHQMNIILLCIAALLAAAFLSGCAQPAVQTSLPTTPVKETSAPSTAPPTATIPSRFTVVPLPTRFPTVASEATGETEMPNSNAAPVPSGSSIEGWIQQAVQDLSTRLQVPADSIKFIEFEPVVWPDGSLGCPKPGVFYTQVLVEGYRIHLEHNGERYTYHGSMDQRPFLCEEK